MRRERAEPAWPICRVVPGHRQNCPNLPAKLGLIGPARTQPASQSHRQHQQAEAQAGQHSHAVLLGACQAGAIEPSDARKPATPVCPTDPCRQEERQLQVDQYRVLPGRQMMAQHISTLPNAKTSSHAQDNRQHVYRPTPWLPRPPRCKLQPAVEQWPSLQAGLHRQGQVPGIVAIAAALQAGLRPACPLQPQAVQQMQAALLRIQCNTQFPGWEGVPGGGWWLSPSQPPCRPSEEATAPIGERMRMPYIPSSLQPKQNQAVNPERHSIMDDLSQPANPQATRGAGLRGFNDVHGQPCSWERVRPKARRVEPCTQLRAPGCNKLRQKHEYFQMSQGSEPMEIPGSAAAQSRRAEEKQKRICSSVERPWAREAHHAAPAGENRCTQPAQAEQMDAETRHVAEQRRTACGGEARRPGNSPRVYCKQARGKNEDWETLETDEEAQFLTRTMEPSRAGRLRVSSVRSVEVKPQQDGRKRRRNGPRIQSGSDGGASEDARHALLAEAQRGAQRERVQHAESSQEAELGSELPAWGGQRVRGWRYGPRKQSGSDGGASEDARHALLAEAPRGAQRERVQLAGSSQEAELGSELPAWGGQRVRGWRYGPRKQSGSDGGASEDARHALLAEAPRGAQRERVQLAESSQEAEFGSELPAWGGQRVREWRYGPRKQSGSDGGASEDARHALLAEAPRGAQRESVQHAESSQEAELGSELPFWVGHRARGGRPIEPRQQQDALQSADSDLPGVQQLPVAEIKGSRIAENGTSYARLPQPPSMPMHLQNSNANLQLFDRIANAASLPSSNPFGASKSACSQNQPAGVLVGHQPQPAELPLLHETPDSLVPDWQSGNPPREPCDWRTDGLSAARQAACAAKFDALSPENSPTSGREDADRNLLSQMPLACILTNAEKRTAVLQPPRYVADYLPEKPYVHLPARRLGDLDQQLEEEKTTGHCSCPTGAASIPLNTGASPEEQLPACFVASDPVERASSDDSAETNLQEPPAPQEVRCNPTVQLDLPTEEAVQAPVEPFVPCSEHYELGLQVQSLALSRPKRVPGGNRLDRAPFHRFLGMIRTNSEEFEANGRILRLKQYMASDANCAMMEAIIEALACNARVQALYIQNFEWGMHNKQLALLTKVLKKGHIWALNIGENFNISLEGWQRFTDALPQTAVSYLYVSEHHLLRTKLKTQMRDGIRENRRQLPAQDPAVIVRIGNMWWNPKVPGANRKRCKVAAGVANRTADVEGAEDRKDVDA